MNINNISNVATPNTVGQVTASPQVIDAPFSQAGPKNIQPLRLVEQAGKTEKKEANGSQLGAKETKALVDELNEYMDDLQTNIGFSIREDLNRQVVVEIKNRKTDEMVRQIPSEELLIIREKMVELSGFIFDQSV